MKAVIYTQYGAPDVLQVREIAQPAPKDNEVLINVHATTVTAADCLVRKGVPLWGRIILGVKKPRRAIIGNELAGDIVAVGKNVKRFKVGDAVYGFTGFSLGAYAGYTCMRETASLGIKPRNLTYEQAAAAVDGSTTALFFLQKKAHIQRGQKVLIIGASGSIGTYAVQLAKYFGAEVTGVCSTRNLELVTSLGADDVIDYTEEDFTRNGKSYDIIFDTVSKSSFSQCSASLTDNGCYIPTSGLINPFVKLWTMLQGGKRIIGGMSIEKNDALVFLKGLIEAETIKPVIDRTYTVEDIAEAHRYVETGRKRGNVVISMA